MPIDPGQGDQDENPMFVDIENFDFRLQAGSPCIGTGRDGGDRGALQFATGIDDIITLPSALALDSNYPNPFNAATTISYDLPEQSEVSLVIYDLLGREVQTLVNDTEPAGKHTITWHADKVTSGIYFYRLTTGKDVLTQRMTLIK